MLMSLNRVTLEDTIVKISHDVHGDLNSLMRLLL